MKIVKSNYHIHFITYIKGKNQEIIYLYVINPGQTLLGLYAIQLLRILLCMFTMTFQILLLIHIDKLIVDGAEILLNIVLQHTLREIWTPFFTYWLVYFFFYHVCLNLLNERNWLLERDREKVCLCVTEIASEWVRERERGKGRWEKKERIFERKWDTNRLDMNSILFLVECTNVFNFRYCFVTNKLFTYVYICWILQYIQQTLTTF